MNVTLTWTEMLIATYVASMRQIGNMKAGRKPRYGAAEIDGAWDKHIVSCQAEMAVAKMLNLFWSGAVGNLRAADVGTIQVRATTYPKGRLILHPHDDDGDLFYLVRATPPHFDVVGSIIARDGKQPIYWTSLPHHNPPRPAFFVPDTALHLCSERQVA